jgi:hypothetical protein
LEHRQWLDDAAQPSIALKALEETLKDLRASPHALPAEPEQQPTAATDFAAIASDAQRKGA